jgi:uncharacterized protein YkwD
LKISGLIFVFIDQTPFMMYFHILFAILLGATRPSYLEDQMAMVNAVNEIRAKGCHCGRRYMEPVAPIKWNEVLFKSAYIHAKEMHDNNFFAHYNMDGLNIGERLEKVGYKWQVAGENLGEGQESFQEVLVDWRRSYSHCTMLMHPKVTEMGVARFNNYWVQHFGKKMEKPNN